MSNLKRKISQIKILRKMVESKGNIVNDSDKYIYCGLCQNRCPVNAITVSRNEKKWSIEHEFCVRCTHCVEKCPTKALTLKK